MSKQYLTTASHDTVHPSPIFSLASTPDHLISISGSSSIQIHSSTSSSFPHSQTLSNAHKLGAHHVSAARDGSRFVSVGFGGEVIVWSHTPEDTSSPWTQLGALPTTPSPSSKKSKAASSLWSISLSADGTLLAGTTITGSVKLYNITSPTPSDWKLQEEIETKGRFGLCIDISPASPQPASYSSHSYGDEESKGMLATGHDNGSLYIFSLASTSSSTRLRHALPSLSNRAVRTVKFSPAGTLLAAAGDAGVIGLYDAVHGEQVGLLTGHSSWVMALDWSVGTGEYIVSGDYGGKVRVWRTETKECVSVISVEEGEGAIWSLVWLQGGGSGSGSAKRPDGFVLGTEGGGLRFLREAAGG